MLYLKRAVCNNNGKELGGKIGWPDAATDGAALKDLNDDF